MPKTNLKSKAIAPEKKRSFISQGDIPAFSLTQALRVAEALQNNFGKEPAKPLMVAKAMNLSPNSSGFKMLTGAAIAFGLTQGGYNAVTIALTPLGRRIVAPKSEGDDLLAKREAVLKPTIIANFLSRYDGSPLPAQNIAINVLDDMGVPRERAQEVYDMILDGAAAVGFIETIKDKKYVSIGSPVQATKSEEPSEREMPDEPERLSW